MDRAAAAHGKLDTCIEPCGDDNEMKTEVSIVRTDPFTFTRVIRTQLHFLSGLVFLQILQAINEREENL